MLKAGINDPVKVTRSALQNAASIAGLFLTTEAVVADKPEPASAPAPQGGGMHGGPDRGPEMRPEGRPGKGNSPKMRGGKKGKGGEDDDDDED
jgi:hypothetical protein